MLDGGGFSQEEIDLLLDNVDQLSESELQELEGIVSDLAERQRVQTLRNDLISFCQHMQNDYKVGGHHKRLANLLEDIEARRKDRICVSIPPRHGKSQLVSIYYAAWYMGRNPSHKVMLVSHTTDLAVDFGRKIRNLIATDKYREVFPDVALASDSKSAGRWNTNQGGEFFAAGVGSALAGRGAHLLLVDDPHALQIDTQIPTTEGFKAMKDVQVGDYVFGPDGEPTCVVAKSDIWHDRELYSVVTSDGEEIVCDAAHLWGVNSDTSLSKAKVYNFTTEYLANWPKANRPVLPRHQPVQYAAKALQVDPWVLGAWLGDGTSSSGKMTAHPDDQDHIKSEIRKAGYDMSANSADGFTFNVLGLMKQLRALGVLNNKHIPEAYLTASVEQRMALLQGLVDTDGSVNAATGQTGFYNCNRALVDGVKEILHSLGVKATVRTYHDTRGRYATVRPNHRVMWKLADSARMPRKARYCRTPMDKRSRSIEVENTGARGSVQCLTVERSDGLFLCGRSYVVTHNSEQDILNGNYSVFDKAYEWFTFGARTRLMPYGAVAIVHTRWAPQDLIGRVVADMAKNEGADQYEVFEFPAILTVEDPDTGGTVERALWPEFFDIPALLRTKASMPTYQWNAQYQQQPTSEEAAIVKREWWRLWLKDQPPPCDYIIASLDAAAETHNRADYTSLTVWGVFMNEEEGHHQLMLLHAIKERLEFPELKRIALEVYKEWEPDAFIVEKKSAGVALYQELRRTGLPVQEYTPHRGTGDKMVRLNSVADIISSGLVWTPDRRWAEEVVEEVAAFPFGPNDDHVDSTVMALLRFRQGGFIALPTDEIDEPEYTLPMREGYY